MRKFQRKCDCGKCVYCGNHERYLRELDVRKERGKIRHLLVKEREAEVFGLIGALNNRVIDSVVFEGELRD